MRRGLGFAAAALCAVIVASLPARAQIASTPPPQGPLSGWTFAVTPYIWLPTLSADLQANGPRGGTVSTSISAGVGDYLSEINFGLMLGAMARHDRFSVMTDLIYMNASLTTSTNHLSSVNLGPGPIYIPRSQQLSTGSRLTATVWSLAGGYTLLRGDWGNLDAVVGMRMLAVGDTTNYQLSFNIFGPNRTIVLSRSGSLDIGRTYFNAIGGITGRLNIPKTRFYLPFYLDAGGGGVPLTWEAYGGVAYRAASWADISAGYRYLTFQGNGSTGVHNLSLSGAILTANFRF
jgi:hypothetical protein